MNFKGIFPPAITPMNDDHSIDEDGFAAGTVHPPMQPLEANAKDGLRGIPTTTKSVLQTILSEA